MSVTATLLLGLPIRIDLPVIGRTIHTSEKTRCAIKPGQQQGSSWNERTRQANIERVFDAINTGFSTIRAIMDYTELSEATVKKALHELEDWPGNPRIKHAVIRQKHVFSVNESN